jgi:hypothetical protein
MMEFEEWCEAAAEVVNGHDLKVLSGSHDHLVAARDKVAEIVPTHYACEEHVARVLERLGKAEAADFVRQKLPESKAVRSGDLGEILATEYIAENTPYEVPIKRLRWKDHRNMAMRGDDVIGIEQNPENGRLKFLKSEAKSRSALPAGVLVEARAVLEKDGGLPSPHALSFVSERLMETGNRELADAIDDAQLKHGIAYGASGSIQCLRPGERMLIPRRAAKLFVSIVILKVEMHLCFRPTRRGSVVLKMSMI